MRRFLSFLAVALLLPVGMARAQSGGLDIGVAVAPEQALPNQLIGGEAIRAELWRNLVAHNSRHNRVAYNLYGPTECTVNSSACLIAGERPQLGEALSGVSLYVLDDALQPVPVGAPEPPLSVLPQAESEPSCRIATKAALLP